jgi:ATP-dependent DNA helicase PIF1
VTKVAFPVAGGSHTSVVDVSLLESKQKLAYYLFVNHCQSWASSVPTPPIFVHMDGEGSTRKTTVVRTMCYGIDTIAADYGLPSPVLRSTPTGVAAHNIGGQTLHSLLRLPVKKVAFEDLPVAPLKALQSKFKHINYLIIDEKSIVGLQQLSFVNRRLQQIKANDEDFGGISILLLGDFCQLPPVAATPLFSTAPHRFNNSDHISSQRL